MSRGLLPTSGDLDLDRTPEEVPATDRTSWPAAVLVLVLATLGGAWLHAGSAGSVAEAPPRVSARVELDAVRLAEHPVAVLHLVVTSHDDATVYLASLRVDGAGLAGREQRVRRALTPGLVEDLRLTAKLTCNPGTRPPPLSLTLTVTRDPGPIPAGTRAGDLTLSAVPGGVAQLPGGLCRAAEHQLPQAYRTPVTVRTMSISDDALTLAVSGLPAAEVFSVQADGWLLPMPSGTVRATGAATTITVGPPEPRCEDTGTRGVLPTGLQLVFTTEDAGRIHEAYAPVGTALASWLLHARQRACPA